MKTIPLLAWVSLAWPVLSQAQASLPSPAAAVADPGAAVPALHYRSALQTGPRGVSQETEDWKAANGRVGQYLRGHSDILKAEQAQGSAAPQASPARPAATPGHTMPMHPHGHGHPPPTDNARPKAHQHQE